jgi:hypothetical protein
MTERQARQVKVWASVQLLPAGALVSGMKKISSANHHGEEGSGSDEGGWSDGWMSGSVGSMKSAAAVGESSATGCWDDDEKEESSSGQGRLFDGWGVTQH